MNNQFDELTKQMAQSVTRRAALKKFGLGLAGMALACFGLANKTRGATLNGYCQVESRRTPFSKGNKWFVTGSCIVVDPATGVCFQTSSSACPAAEYVGNGKLAPCNGYWGKVPCSHSY